MAEETSSQAALNRLEQALRRVEAAAETLKGSGALEARHQALQGEVQATLTGLDRLLAAAETR